MLGDLEYDPWHFEGFSEFKGLFPKLAIFVLIFFYSGLNLRKTHEPQLCYAKSERKAPSQATAILFKCAHTFVGVPSSTGCLLLAHPWHACLPGKTPKKDRVDRRICCNMPHFPSHIIFSPPETRWKRAISPINNHISYPCCLPTPQYVLSVRRLDAMHLTSKVHFFGMGQNVPGHRCSNRKKTWLLIGGLEHDFFSHILGISSSQLTFTQIFQRGRYTNQIKLVNPFR